MGSLFAILMAIGCTSSPAEPESTQEDVTDTPGQVTDPGQVNDLIVTDSTGTSVTLSFTQVDDGTGNPAEYAVRWHAGPMNWGAAEEVSQGTCAAPLQGTAIGATIACTIEGLSPEVGYTFQVAAFRGTFQTGAVYGELSNVVPDMEAEPEQSGPSNGSYPHEPGGYTTLAVRTFSQFGEGGWYDNTTSDNYHVGLTDSGAPSGNVGRVRYWAGMDGGISPASAATAFKLDGQSELYIHFWIKFDDNWQGHDSGVNKIMFVTDESYSQAGAPVYVAAYGANSAELQLQVRLQGSGSLKSLSSGSANLKPNIGSGKISRGQWHRVEIVLVMNSGTDYDGEAHVWVDGQKSAEYRDVMFEDSNSSGHRFDNVRWGPVWGGMGDTVAGEMFMWMDDLYIAGSDD